MRKLLALLAAISIIGSAAIADFDGSTIDYEDESLDFSVEGYVEPVIGAWWMSSATDYTPNSKDYAFDYGELAPGDDMEDKSACIAIVAPIQNKYGSGVNMKLSADDFTFEGSNGGEVEFKVLFTDNTNASETGYNELTVGSGGTNADGEEVVAALAAVGLPGDPTADELKECLGGEVVKMTIQPQSTVPYCPGEYTASGTVTVALEPSFN